MTDDDPLRVQRDVTAEARDQLCSAGFDEVEEIARGRSGAVYRCTWSAIGRTVAVKVLTGEMCEENRERFFRDQRAVSRLAGQPNIAEVLEVGTTNSGWPYLVMPYFPQGSLNDWIGRRGTLATAEALGLGMTMAAVLETAHRAGILHLNVKPTNILITDQREPALTDFGTAHPSEGLDTDTVTESSAFTAPEVVGGHSLTTATDVYGLGAALFAALTGQAAFDRRSGERPVAQMRRSTSGSVTDLREVGVDGDVAAAIEHAMAYIPEDRPTMAAFGERLRIFQTRSGFPLDKTILRAKLGTARRAEKANASVRPTNGGLPVRPSTGVLPRDGGNLPIELSTFLGRRTELTEVKRLLGSSRLVTLTGIGGVGKTRLAVHVAFHARRGFSGGVWFIELGEFHEGISLEGAVVASLGLRQQSARPVREILMDFLGSREVLMVLDNCEQVVEAAAELSEALLGVCPGLRILATSREALGIGGEAVLQVPPLTVPSPGRDPSLQGLLAYDGVALFVDRAEAVLPGFELTEDNSPIVARICTRLEGLPLAIELAAGRLLVLSPEQILQRLTDRFTILARSRRGAPTRQQTLRVCIDWSYELCTDAEKLLWEQLSVFSGGVELDAAERICRGDEGSDDLLDVLTALVDKSILIREQFGTSVRLRMLDTLRDYGLEKAREAGELPDLRRRHKDWYRQLALDAESQWISAGQLDWIARLDREQPNLREALEFALTDDSALAFAAALQPFWVSLGQLDEGRHWLDRALAAEPAATSTVRCLALVRCCVLAELQGDLAAASLLVDQARSLAEQSTDPIAHAWAGFIEGRHDVYTADNLDHARTRLKHAHNIFVAQGDHLGQVLSLLNLGWACELQKDIAETLACHEKALALTESLGESVYRSEALWGTAVASWIQGDRDHALRLMRQALDLVWQRRAPNLAATCLEALAWVEAAGGSVRRAAVLLGAAHTQGQMTGSPAVIFPGSLAHHQQCVRTTRRELGERDFEIAYQEGAVLNLDEALTYALGAGAENAQPTGDRSADLLTNREQQVADLVAEGLTNKAIATRLFISLRTAAGHVEHILTKLGFTSRTQIAAWVVEHRQR